MPTIDFDLTCSACDADLRGVDLYANCLHCHVPVAGSINLEAINATTGAVTADTHCDTCGYNLRTLALGALCPECAAPVAASLRPDSLHYADAQWLDNLAAGLTLLVVALIGIPFAVLVAQVTSVIVSSSITEAVAMLTALAILPLLLFGVAATHNITADDPSVSAQMLSPWNRRIAHVFVLFICPMTLLVFGAQISGGAGPRLKQITVAMVIIVLITAPLAIAATLRCLRHIAHRARQPHSARGCAILFWLTVVAGSLIAVGSILSLGRPTITIVQTTPAPPLIVPSPLRIVIALALTSGAVLLLVDWLFGLIILFRFRRLLAGIRAVRTRMSGPLELHVQQIDGLD